ncbi:DUF1360 domain-containing protein [Rhodopirellula bahusiensis]|uniref:DUF1360 domain-containing protein n=1 Tax=Rhodopirellula bahusiensis TaxID=2014065 RepID=A0A2G1WDV6_9BACT|nr:DUF1360 domain-containing protein [Rhodopirellula bahusiensis]PHQ37233.1 DUF1360 domain-containing protein [Rhodopirellula bahusiensis]
MTTETIQAIWACVAIAIAASSISITITQTEVFAAWRRFTNKLGHMPGYLFQCFYCIKHWIVFLAIAIYQPVIVDSGSLLADLILSAFFTVTLSTLVSGVMFRSFMGAMNKKRLEAEIKLADQPKS